MQDYDIVLDCTDKPETRYLVSDAAVILNIHEVFASAAKVQGQLMVLERGGPCYRCLFPVPPPPETVQNCSDVGILGPGKWFQHLTSGWNNGHSSGT